MRVISLDMTNLQLVSHRFSSCHGVCKGARAQYISELCLCQQTSPYSDVDDVGDGYYRIIDLVIHHSIYQNRNTVLSKNLLRPAVFKKRLGKKIACLHFVGAHQKT